ncbi:hypothetical protein TNCV_2929181 [Trichonephila clavipes]|nr:hypothetical protein TNCV_2929181 [Trichonephila clavipes]
MVSPEGQSQVVAWFIKCTSAEYVLRNWGITALGVRKPLTDWLGLQGIATEHSDVVLNLLMVRHENGLARKCSFVDLRHVDSPFPRRLAPCHDEFRGPRSAYVRQVALAPTTQQANRVYLGPCELRSTIVSGSRRSNLPIGKYIASHPAG